MAEKEDKDKLQKSIIVITLILGLYIIIASIGIGIYYHCKMPITPNYQSDTNETIAKYIELVNSINEQQNSMFDIIVQKTPLGIFNTLIATILGFIFVKPIVDSLINRWGKKDS